MSKQPTFRKPPGGVKVKRVTFKFENGKEIFLTDLDVAKELWEDFCSEPEIDKKNAYFVLENKVIFLEQVNEISFNLESEDEYGEIRRFDS